MPIDTRRLGRTDVEVTTLGFGTAALGELFVTVPEPQAHATLQAAWDAGIRYFDTAPWYGLGLAEHRLGSFLHGQHARRVPRLQQGRALAQAVARPGAFPLREMGRRPALRCRLRLRL